MTKRRLFYPFITLSILSLFFVSTAVADWHPAPIGEEDLENCEYRARIHRQASPEIFSNVVFNVVSAEDSNGYVEGVTNPFRTKTTKFLFTSQNLFSILNRSGLLTQAVYDAYQEAVQNNDLHSVGLAFENGNPGQREDYRVTFELRTLSGLNQTSATIKTISGDREDSYRLFLEERCATDFSDGALADKVEKLKRQLKRTPKRFNRPGSFR